MVIFKLKLDESKPIYLQVKQYIENLIINESLKANERVPSTNEFAKFYQINPATAAKGVNELVDEGIIYKRRGVGMFVAEHARDYLLKERKEDFYERYILPLKKEAEKLGMTEEELINLMKR